MKKFCRTICCCMCCCSKKNEEPLIPTVDADGQIDNNKNNDNEENNCILPKDLRESQVSTDNQNQNEENQQIEKQDEKEEKKEEQPEESKENSNNIIIPKNEPVEYYLPQYIDDTLSDENVFENKYYREDELDIKKFSKRTIVALIESEYDPSKDQNYQIIHNKNGMILSVDNQRTFLSTKLPMIRMIYKIKKTEFKEGTTIQLLDSLVNTPEKRLAWDTGLKEYKYNEFLDSYSIIYSQLKNPIPFMSPRDLIDKKIDFYHNNTFYSFASSISDDFYPVVKGVERIIEIINCFSIGEDEENFIFRTLSQGDFKVPSNNTLLSITLPGKLRDWYKKLKEVVNKNNE